MNLLYFFEPLFGDLVSLAICNDKVTAMALPQSEKTVVPFLDKSRRPSHHAAACSISWTRVKRIATAGFEIATFEPMKSTFIRSICL